MSVAQRLPFPYRPEAEVVARHLQSVSQSLDWAAAARAATPWCRLCATTHHRFGRWRVC